MFTICLNSFASEYIEHVIQGSYQVQFIVDIITHTQPLLSQSSRLCFVKFESWLDCDQDTNPTKDYF